MPGADPRAQGPERWPAAPADPTPNWAWPVLLTLLTALSVLHVGWFLREELPADSPLLQRLQAWRVPGFAPSALATAVPAESGRMHLVSRDLHAHPTRQDALVLSATFVNLSSRAQPYPRLTLLLLDPDSRPLQGRTFEPSEYLAAAAQDEWLAPGQHVPVLLEFTDPGERAVGFEIAFH